MITLFEFVKALVERRIGGLEMQQLNSVTLTLLNAEQAAQKAF